MAGWCLRESCLDHLCRVDGGHSACLIEQYGLPSLYECVVSQSCHCRHRAEFQETENVCFQSLRVASLWVSFCLGAFPLGPYGNDSYNTHSEKFDTPNDFATHGYRRAAAKTYWNHSSKKPNQQSFAQSTCSRLLLEEIFTLKETGKTLPGKLKFVHCCSSPTFRVKKKDAISTFFLMSSPSDVYSQQSSEPTSAFSFYNSNRSFKQH